MFDTHKPYHMPLRGDMRTEAAMARLSGKQFADIYFSVIDQKYKRASEMREGEIYQVYDPERDRVRIDTFRWIPARGKNNER
jgi:hypothetical protein